MQRNRNSNIDNVMPRSNIIGLHKWKVKDVFLATVLLVVMQCLNHTKTSFLLVRKEHEEMGDGIPLHNSTDITTVLRQEQQTQQQAQRRHLSSETTPESTPSSSQQQIQIDDILQCTNSTSVTDTGASHTECCVPWDAPDHLMDDWWTHHPDWDVSSETNHRGVCFARMTNPDRAALFRKLYALQFPHPRGHANMCENDLQAHQINAGYGASINQIVKGLWAAYNQGRPFQLTKHWEGARWLFATNRTDHWGYCPTTDMNCYFLEISSCPPVYRRNDKYNASAVNTVREKQHYQWVRQYATRPRFQTRRKLHEFMQQRLPVVADATNTNASVTVAADRQSQTRSLLYNNCTSIHIRRGDVGYPRHPFRRYAAVKEYLEIGNITTGSNIVLLTDDQSTIEEVQTYHSQDYRWIYMDRPRNTGVQGGMDGHIPSGNEAQEVLTIMAEVKLASNCNKLVHGHSGFVVTIKDEMDTSGVPYESILLDTKLSWDELRKWRNQHNPSARVDHMMAQIQAHHNTTNWNNVTTALSTTSVSTTEAS